MRKKLLLILFVLSAVIVQARNPSGKKIINDYCHRLPKDFMLEGKIFHDKDSRHILQSFLERQQRAESSDTIYIITQTTPALASERVYIVRGDRVLYMKQQEQANDGVYIIRASQCKASDYFTEEYLSMLRTMSVSQMPFEYTGNYYDVARLIYVKGRLASYDSDHHFVTGCKSAPMSSSWISIPFPAGKTYWKGRFHPSRADYNIPPIPVF